MTPSKPSTLELWKEEAHEILLTSPCMDLLKEARRTKALISLIEKKDEILSHIIYRDEDDIAEVWSSSDYARKAIALTDSLGGDI